MEQEARRKLFPLNVEERHILSSSNQDNLYHARLPYITTSYGQHPTPTSSWRMFGGTSPQPAVNIYLYKCVFECVYTIRWVLCALSKVFQWNHTREKRWDEPSENSKHSPVWPSSSGQKRIRDLFALDLRRMNYSQRDSHLSSARNCFAVWL